MQLIVNGDVRDVEDAPTVGAFLASRGLNAKMVVVERNGEIVPRGQYDETPLQGGDVLEIVQMMAGG
jgi:sulfur carrier protein